MSRKRNLCTCVLERAEITAYKISVIILRYIRNVISLSYSKSILKLQIFLQKHPFFFNSEAILKMAKETNKGDVENICTRVTKPASRKVGNAEVDLK